MNVPPIWFWSFWHWSTEGFRADALLRGPIQGIGGHWDEWYRHEASIEERHAIDETGRTARGQREFIAWLVRHWAREAQWRGEHPPARFVLGQLASLAPFDAWHAFDRYRTEYGVGGIAAVVLEEGSQGEAADVRHVEAIALPADGDSTSLPVVAEGFTADATDLRTVRDATRNVLRGRGLALLIALWTAFGRRPYPTSVAVMLASGWVVAAALIVRLLVGPDPGTSLRVLAASLAALWGMLVISGLAVVGAVAVQAWRHGRRCAERLDRSQLRLRMEGGLSLVGGSAGLPFCINALVSVLRTRSARQSWLWNRVERGIRAEWRRWAATGVITPDGRVRAVAVEAKVRAVLAHGGMAGMLVPRQRDAGEPSPSRPIPSAARAPNAPSPRPRGEPPARRLGFAREMVSVRNYRCGHVAQAVMTVGALTSRWQAATRVLAVAVSVVMLAALPDLRAAVFPEPSPNVIAPFSASPYQVWVSLDARHADEFSVVLESRFWANRRAPVVAYAGASAPPRAELQLQRLPGQLTGDIDDGTVWVERRRRFLTREYAPGERVGRYSLSYVARLHE